MPAPKVRLEFWMADRLGFNYPGPVILEEPIEENESLRSLLNHLLKKYPHFSEGLFDPASQSISSEVTIIINDLLPPVSHGLDVILRPGDRIIFLPILAGG